MSQRSRPPIHPNVLFARRWHALVTWTEHWSVLLLVVFASGTLLLAYAAAEAEPSRPLRAYNAVQLLLFDSSDDETKPFLTAARVCAIATGLVGLLEILRRLFDVVLQRIVVRAAYSRHVVVCGLDAVGLALCEALVESGCAVVGVDRQAGPRVTRARRMGVLVQIGDPLDGDTLEAVGVDNAAWMTALGSGSAVVAAARQTLASGRSEALKCMIAPPSVTAEPRPMLLPQRRLSTKGLDVLQANVADRAASYLIADAGVFRHVLDCASTQELEASADVRRVLVVGDEEVSERLACLLAWDGGVVYSSAARRAVIEVTLAHPRASRVLEGLRGILRKRLEDEKILPALHARSFELPLESAFLTDDVLFASVGDDAELRPAFDTVFVCCESIDHTLAVADRIVRRYTERALPHLPLVIAVSKEHEVAPALEELCFQPCELGRAGPVARSDGRRLLYVYEIWKRSLDARRFFGANPALDQEWGPDAVERLAASTHEAYRRHVQALYGAAAKPPEPWSTLAPERRDSSRHFVRDIDRKLALVGCVRALAERGEAPGATLTGVEVECLARAEHERWMIERWEDGWSLATIRDLEMKLSGSLKPWHELDEPTREIDRRMIRSIGPEILGPEGFRIERAPARPDGAVRPSAEALRLVDVPAAVRRPGAARPAGDGVASRS